MVDSYRDGTLKDICDHMEVFLLSMDHRKLATPIHISLEGQPLLCHRGSKEDLLNKLCMVCRNQDDRSHCIDVTHMRESYCILEGKYGGPQDLDDPF